MVDPVKCLKRLKRLQLGSWNLQRLPARGTEFLSGAQRVGGDGRKIEEWRFGKGHPLEKMALYWISVLDFWGVVGCFLQPIWKICACSSNGIISPGWGVKITHVWNHHLEKMDFTGVIHRKKWSYGIFLATYPKKPGFYPSKVAILRTYIVHPCCTGSCTSPLEGSMMILRLLKQFLRRFHTSEESSHLLIQKLLWCNSLAMRRHTAMLRER